MFIYCLNFDKAEITFVTIYIFKIFKSFNNFKLQPSFHAGEGKRSPTTIKQHHHKINSNSSNTIYIQKPADEYFYTFRSLHKPVFTDYYDVFYFWKM
jgi:hypothetical protein